MTTITSIITDAYREGNLIAAGASPTTTEQNEALRIVQRFVDGVFGEEMGENLVDWLVPVPQRTAPVAANFPQLPYPQGADGYLLGTPAAAVGSFAFYPPKNSRLIFGGVTGAAYFPEAPDDGSRMAVVQGSGAGDSGVVGAVLTLNGNGRTIEAVNTKTFTFASPATAPVQWLYRADLGDWAKVSSSLALSDQMPFPQDLDDLWVCMVSMRLSPRYGKTISDDTARTAARMMKKLKAKYRQAGITVYKAGDIPNSFQSYAANWDWW